MSRKKKGTSAYKPRSLPIDVVSHVKSHFFDQKCSLLWTWLQNKWEVVSLATSHCSLSSPRLPSVGKNIVMCFISKTGIPTAFRSHWPLSTLASLCLRSWQQARLRPHQPCWSRLSASLRIVNVGCAQGCWRPGCHGGTHRRIAALMGRYPLWKPRSRRFHCGVVFVVGDGEAVLMI